MTARTVALQLGLFARDRAGAKHAAEIARLVPLVQRLAAAHPAGITVDDLREAAGLGPGVGRELSWLGAVMRAAGLVATGARCRSTLEATHGNWRAVWRRAED